MKSVMIWHDHITYLGGKKIVSSERDALMALASIFKSEGKHDVRIVMIPEEQTSSHLEHEVRSTASELASSKLPSPESLIHKLEKDIAKYNAALRYEADALKGRQSSRYTKAHLTSG